MSTDSRLKYLQKLGNSYYIRVKVPPSLQAIVGNTHIRKALHTRSLDVANTLKWPLLANIKRHLEKLKLADPGGTNARFYREAIREARGAEDYGSMETLELLAHDDAEKIFKSTGDLSKAQAWLQRATTDKQLLSELLEVWIEGSEYTQQTKDKHRRAYSELMTYMGGDRLPEGVTDRTALEYVDNFLKPLELGRETKAGRLTSLSTFWDWLGSRLYVPKGQNPFKGHRLSTKIDQKRSPDKRPYTEQELVRLLSGFQGAINVRSKDKTTVASLVLLGLYTGARLDELCSLSVEDIDEVDGHYFVRVKDSKTEAGKREFAISHPVPVAVLKARLSTVKAGYIFPDLLIGGRDQKRSHYVSRQYTVIRRKLGIPDGTDFHSFRRSFMTLLENLGVDYILSARYVGHQIPTLMHSTYSGGSWRQTSLQLANRVDYGEEVEGAARELLGFAISAP